MAKKGRANILARAVVKGLNMIDLISAAFSTMSCD